MPKHCLPHMLDYSGDKCPHCEADFHRHSAAGSMPENKGRPIPTYDKPIELSGSGTYLKRCELHGEVYTANHSCPQCIVAIEKAEALAKEGHKADNDKPRFSLVPLSALSEVIKVLEFGAKKYAPDNWQKVPAARTRYYDAAMRHLTAWFSGERNDPESGIHHLAHAGCCVLFLLWFEVKSDG